MFRMPAEDRVSCTRDSMLAPGALSQGFSERLNRDLAMKAPSNMRFKLMSATGAAERRLGAWVSYVTSQ